MKGRAPTVTLMLLVRRVAKLQVLAVARRMALDKTTNNASAYYPYSLPLYALDVYASVPSLICFWDLRRSLNYWVDAVLRSILRWNCIVRIKILSTTESVSDFYSILTSAECLHGLQSAESLSCASNCGGGNLRKHVLHQAKLSI